ncbi:glycosyltransferase [Thalictrum thalictroides]|uniref:Glycosyltransferase n=1 Tax=Thalictrum thalictroides TaxID=46969 RepID=A0A7J6W327_THATH|nr:glycosyltransferase [Thalictrum thalictroides]
MSILHQPKKKSLTSSPLRTLTLVFCLLFVLYIVSLFVTHTLFDHVWSKSLCTTSFDDVVFGIASSTKGWPKRKNYVQLWWKPQFKGCIFFDKVPDSSNSSDNIPPVCISKDASHFRYTNKYRGGLRSSIRVARVVSETVALNHSNVKWYVFGDDDTIFIPENLVKTLSKYDHNQWYYIGTNSEVWEHNHWLSHEMAFGGAGFAMSYPLAKVFAKVFDSCLVRYPHLYSSDVRIYSCLAELGVLLTHESGFHQYDVEGDIFGLLAAHPLKPLVSLHHLDHAQPIFPNMTTIQGLQHLFKAVKLDPARILQQTVCYDKRYTLTVLISWGYAVQVFDRDVLLPDLLRVQKTFKRLNHEGTARSNLFMFNTKVLPQDECKRPMTFFVENISSSSDRMSSSYKRSINESCLESSQSFLKDVVQIRVFSQKLDLDVLKAPRRQCCDVIASSVGKRLDVAIRECGEEELVFMHA